MAQTAAQVSDNAVHVAATIAGALAASGLLKVTNPNAELVAAIAALAVQVALEVDAITGA